MLPFRVTPETYNAYSDEIKSHYKKSGDGYELDTVGDHPQVANMRDQLGRMGIENANLQTEVTTLKGQITTAEATAEAKYKAALDKANASLSKLQETAATTAQQSAINEVAGRFTAPDLFTASLKDRIKVTVKDDGTTQVTYHDKDGKVVDKQVLHDEYLKNPAYTAMLKKDGVPPTINQQPPAPQQQQPQQPSTSQTTVLNQQPSGTWHVDAATGYVVANGRLSDTDMAAAIAAMPESQVS